MHGIYAGKGHLLGNTHGLAAPIDEKLGFYAGSRVLRSMTHGDSRALAGRCENYMEYRFNMSYVKHIQAWWVRSERHLKTVNPSVNTVARRPFQAPQPGWLGV